MSDSERQQLLDEIKKRDLLIDELSKRLDEQGKLIAELQNELEKWRRGHYVRPGGKISQKKKAAPPLEGRKPGQKKGHEGAGREAPEHVDRYVDVPAPEQCPDCASLLEPSDVGLHKVEELVPARVEVIGYRRHAGYCARCCKTVRASLPEGLGHNPKLGLNVQALIAQERAEFGLTLGQIKKMRERDGLRVTTGGIQQILHRSAQTLKPAMEQIQKGVRESKVAWGDETPWKIWGTVGYMWLVMTKELVFYKSAPTRAKIVLEEMLQGFSGKLHSDFYAVYLGMPNVENVLCWSHLLKKARQVAEREERGDRARRFYKRLQEIYVEACEAQKNLEGAEAEAAAEKLEAKLKELGEEKEYEKNEEVKKLQNRIVRERAGLMRFVKDKRLEGTNNASERELRMLAMMRHVSGGARSEEGGETMAALLSVAKTLKKQGREFMKVWKEARAAQFKQGPQPCLTPPSTPLN
jgi:transposase